MSFSRVLTKGRDVRSTGGSLSLIVFALVLLAGCSPAVAASPATRKISLPMGYIPNVQFAPFYVALEKGYFLHEGIDLSFDYKFETDGVALVGAGNLPFSVVSGDQVLLARSQSLPVVYVATWWNGYPIAVMSLAESNIRTVADLTGKKVGIPALFGASYVGFRALLNAGGIREDQLQLDVIGYNQAEALIGGQEDAVVVYANNEPVQLKARGYSVNVILVADAVNLASNGLITNEETIRTDPALIRGMVRALLQGVADTIADPDEAYVICKKYVEISPDQDAIQRQVLAASIQFWISNNPGWSDPAAWQNMESTERSMGLLPDPLNISDAFSNDFLPPASH